MQKKLLVGSLLAALAFIIWAVFTLGWFHTYTSFHTKDNQHLVFNADETLVAASARGDGIYLWNTSEQGVPRRLSESDLAIPLCFQADGKTLLAVQDGRLVNWLSNGAKMVLGKDGNRPRREDVRNAAYCQDDSLLAVLQTNRERTLQAVTRYDTMTLMEWQGVSCFAWCQQDMIAVGYASRIELWSVNGKVKLHEWSVNPTKEENRNLIEISGLCYAPLDKTLLACNHSGDLYHWGTSHDSVALAKRKDAPKRPYTNIGAISYRSLRAWGTSPLYVGALTNTEVKVWRFYGGKLEPLTVQNKPLDEHQHLVSLSPSARWTTIRRYQQGSGHVECLVPVTVTIPTNK